MKIIIIGGDGFCGWPTSLHLSKKGHDILILDNLSRRKIDIEINTRSFTNICSIQKRIQTWNSLNDSKIEFKLIDVAKDYHKLKTIIQEFNPDSIIHFAEQRSAPYSMKNEDTRIYTVNNNLMATHNILNSIIEVNKNIHLVHLGSMGVYGYGTISDVIIPEGYLDVKIKNKNGQEQIMNILHPSYPGSIYHLTKTQDALFFQYYTKNWGIKITDLHQGIIWGLHTEETKLHPDLINRLDQDSDYGTVLNRFLLQSVCNEPLTIYGTGEQTRAFIHIQNSVECIHIAIENPPPMNDKVKIFNQMTETIQLNKLTSIIQKIYPDTTLQYIKNPRKELIKNNLEVENKQFLDLGLKPIYLRNENLIKEIYNELTKFKGNFKIESLQPSSFW
jgi:UDP-sulfoquinovose synthase